jgi:hypothetical protein
MGLLYMYLLYERNSIQNFRLFGRKRKWGGGGREREMERKMGRNALKTELIGKS